MRDYLAANELALVANLSAFNVAGATRRKLNQHAVRYTFADGSAMLIQSTLSLGSAWHPDWRGTADDVALGPVSNVPLRINRSA